MNKVILLIITIIIMSTVMVGCGNEVEQQKEREQELQKASSISAELEKTDSIKNRINNSIPENLKLYINIDKTFVFIQNSDKSFMVSIYPKEASLFPIVGDYIIKELDKITKEDDSLNEYSLDITYNTKNAWCYDSKRKSGVFMQAGNIVSPAYTLEELNQYYDLEVENWKKELELQ